MIKHLQYNNMTFQRSILLKKLSQNEPFFKIKGFIILVTTFNFKSFHLKKVFKEM